MALVLADRVLETTTSTGSGTITLAGANPGYQAFSTGVGDGNQTYYTIAGATEWEVGIGTYTASGTTLSRDTVLASSSGGAKITFSAGTKDVFVTYPAERSVESTSANITTLTGTSWTVANLTATSATLTTITGTSANITVITENGSPVVVQTDIGTDPNQIPLNQYLGTIAFQDSNAITVGDISMSGSLTGTLAGGTY